jgi:hypothetical protein
LKLKERKTHVLEQRQHLRIRRVIGDREGKIRIAQNSSNSDQTCSSTRNNANILPSVLTLLPLAIMLIVQTCNGSTQRLDTGGRAVLPSSGGDRDRCRTGEAALDLVISLGGALAEIGPAGGILGVAVLGGSLCAPDYTGRGTGSIETGMGTVSLVGGSELAMSLGPLF